MDLETAVAHSEPPSDPNTEHQPEIVPLSDTEAVVTVNSEVSPELAPLPQRVRRKPVIRSEEVVQLATVLLVQQAPEYDKDGMAVVWEESDNRPEKRKSQDNNTTVKISTQENDSKIDRKRGRVRVEDPPTTSNRDDGKGSDL